MVYQRSNSHEHFFLLWVLIKFKLWRDYRISIRLLKISVLIRTVGFDIRLFYHQSFWIKLITNVRTNMWYHCPIQIRINCCFRKVALVYQQIFFISFLIDHALHIFYVISMYGVMSNRGKFKWKTQTVLYISSKIFNLIWFFFLF